MSLPEVLLWKRLKGKQLDGLHFRKQHPLGRYVLDFYCDGAKLCVEVDGQAHGFGGNPGRDGRRDRWLRAQGVRTLRLSADFVLSEMDGAVAMVRDWAGVAPSSPSVTAREARRATSP
jgi:very-short-patch-repair endonuclease